MSPSCMLMRSTGNLNRTQGHEDMIESVHTVCTYLAITSLDHKISSCK